MDPRHPELALSRMKELIAQYERVSSDIANSTTGSQLGELEREGSLVVREISLVSPRLHEMLIASSRKRRGELVRGVDIPQPTPQAETVIVEPKPRKKKAKKADK